MSPELRFHRHLLAFLSRSRPSKGRGSQCLHVAKQGLHRPAPSSPALPAKVRPESPGTLQDQHFWGGACPPARPCSLSCPLFCSVSQAGFPPHLDHHCFLDSRKRSAPSQRLTTVLRSSLRPHNHEPWFSHLQTGVGARQGCRALSTKAVVGRAAVSAHGAPGLRARARAAPPNTHSSCLRQLQNPITSKPQPDRAMGF